VQGIGMSDKYYEIAMKIDEESKRNLPNLFSKDEITITVKGECIAIGVEGFISKGLDKADKYESLLAISEYEDYKKRICNNCKFWAPKIQRCNNEQSFAFRYSCIVQAYDGCTGFTR
jgi:hypothetical protein